MPNKLIMLYRAYSLFFIVTLYVILTHALSHTVLRYVGIAVRIADNLLLAVIDTHVYLSVPHPLIAVLELCHGKDCCSSVERC
jgi:hypothetical protein